LVETGSTGLRKLSLPRFWKLEGSLFYVANRLALASWNFSFDSLFFYIFLRFWMPTVVSVMED
jgi:hypothetical protein